MTTDLDLLREYARGSEKAFAALVTRHLDLVYSAALRQVRSSQLAEDIAQSVFADLARNVHQLNPDTVLAAWLYQVTRRTALNVSRAEGRRQTREQIAIELADMNATSSNWTQIEPWLDEAMESLDEPDRAAILLRYFDNKGLRDVGKTLGVGEDAAQKRVSRAVERLREFFSKRNVTVGASGLVVLISTNAVQAAPVGLVLSISASVALVGTAVQTSTAIAATTKTIAMTTLQKTLITAVVAVAAGAGIYEANRAANLKKEIQLLRQQLVLNDPTQKGPGDNEDFAKKLAALREENERLNRNTSELLKLRNKISQLQSEANAAVAEAKEYQAEVEEALMSIPPVKTFVATTLADASWGETIVTGGWKTPSGKRALVLMTLEREGNPQQLTISSKILEYTEEAGAEAGLARFNIDEGKHPKAHTLSAAQADAIFKAVEELQDMDIMSAPKMTTLTGRQSQIAVQELHSTPSGEKFSTGPSIDFVPIISADGKSVQMVTTTQLLYPNPNPLNRRR